MKRIIQNKKVNLEILTLKDVVESLVYYDIEHCRFPHNYMVEYFSRSRVPVIKGMCLDDKKLILIDREMGEENTKQTVIHELLHTKHYRIGDLEQKNVETIVEAETDLTYLNLYGVKI